MGLARKIDNKFPLIANGNCMYYWRTGPLSFTQQPTPRAGAGQTKLDPYVNSRTTVGNQRECFIYFTGQKWTGSLITLST